MEPTPSTSSHLPKLEKTTPDSAETKKNSRTKTPSTRRSSAATPKGRKRPANKQAKEQPESSSGAAPDAKDSPSVKDYLLQLMKEGKMPMEDMSPKRRKTTAAIVDEVLLENQLMEVAREETVVEQALMEEGSSSQEQLVEEQEREEVPLLAKQEKQQETNAVNLMIIAKEENVKKTPVQRKKPGYRRVTKGPNKEPVPNYLIDNPPIVYPNPAEYLPKDASGDWTSTELYALYILIKTYGTSDSALEYISGCGLDRESSEIKEFIVHLRELKEQDRLNRMNAFFEYHARIADAAGNEITLARKLPVTESFRETHSKWATAALTISGQYRSFNHSHVRDCLSSCLDKIPETRYADVKATDSWNARRRDQRMDLDFGNIKKFLQQTLSIGSKTAPQLNALESAVVLSVLDDIEKEARQTFDLKQMAGVRGMLRKVKRGDLREFDYDFPCNELTSTQVYIDPFRARDYKLPPGGKPVSLEDVDAGRVCTQLQGGDGEEHRNQLLVQYPSEEANGAYNSMDVDIKIPIHLLGHEANGDGAGPSSPPNTKPHVI